MTWTVTFEWKSADIIPGDYESPVICLTNNGRMMALKDTMSRIVDHTQKSGFRVCSGWNRLVEKYNIKYWVWQTELWPGSEDSIEDYI